MGLWVGFKGGEGGSDWVLLWFPMLALSVNLCCLRAFVVVLGGPEEELGLEDRFINSAVSDS